jgi:transposase
MRYELTDHEWSAIDPKLPNKMRVVPRVNDPRVLVGHELIVARLSRLHPARANTAVAAR